jgi:hypothetical protein
MHPNGQEPAASDQKPDTRNLIHETQNPELWTLKGDAEPVKV